MAEGEPMDYDGPEVQIIDSVTMLGLDQLRIQFYRLRYEHSLRDPGLAEDSATLAELGSIVEPMAAGEGQEVTADDFNEDQWRLLRAANRLGATSLLPPRKS